MTDVSLSSVEEFSHTASGQARSHAPPRSLARVLGMLDALARQPTGMKLVELSDLVDAPTSSLLNLLRPMVVDGYVTLEDMHYRLGPAAFRLSASIMSGWNFSDTLHPFVVELARLTKESVHLGVLDPSGQSIVYVDSIDCARPIRYSAPIGCTRPLHSTAGGRVLLAFAEPKSAKNYLQGLRSADLSRWTAEPQGVIAKELREIRNTHFSMNLQEAASEFGSIAAPVFGLNGSCVAALAVSAPVSELKRRLKELRDSVQSVAKRASAPARRLPHHDAAPPDTTSSRSSRAG